MIDPKVVRNYAACLFENIKSDKERQLVLDQISLFNKIILSSDLIYFAFCSPVISHSEKLKLIEALDKKLRFEKIVSQFFGVIVKNARFKILTAIVAGYEKLLTESRGIKSVVVEAANKPGKKELDVIRKFLENKLKKIVEINLHENKELIGGVVIKHDSLLYDYSVAGAIERAALVAKGARV